MLKNNPHVILLAETDSTNNYAMRLIDQGKVVDQTVVLSSYQQSGKGQQGNSWESSPGLNLLSTIIVYPDFLSPGMQFYLSKIVSLALVDWLRRETTEVAVKWPNDLFVGQKKIAGILIETSIQGNQLLWAVIGIGLNLNQEVFSPEIPNPVGLKYLTRKDYDVYATGLQVRDHFSHWYEKLKCGYFEEIDRSYIQTLFRYNEWATYAKAGHIFEARILGVGEFGKLMLEDRSGIITENYFKEIEFVI
ncbi:MAG: biotin--[acetyl-CoA-carboxylase] ligase [Mariniphaga sp.]|nr:biotin--[acetyl-CoA-carboxylase] ligase [Mariniphaga sp.]